MKIKTRIPEPAAPEVVHALSRNVAIDQAAAHAHLGDQEALGYWFDRFSTRDMAIEINATTSPELVKTGTRSPRRTKKETHEVRPDQPGSGKSG